MRSYRRSLAILVLALAVLVGSSVTPPVARAQFLTIPGAGGVLCATTATTNATNRTDEVVLMACDIPTGYMATASVTNLTPPVRTSNPLHLTLLGTLNTNPGLQNAVGQLSVGVNYGGSTATIALVNNVNLQAALVNVPLKIDVWLSPIATAIGSNTVFLMGRLAYTSLGTGRATEVATETVYNAAVLGTTAVNDSNQLRVLWRWASGTIQNAVNVYNGTVVIGQ